MSNFIDDMENKLSLFETIHGRKPLNYQEFVKWCELVDKNKQTLNSRRNITR